MSTSTAKNTPTTPTATSTPSTPDVIAVPTAATANAPIVKFVPIVKIATLILTRYPYPSPLFLRIPNTHSDPNHFLNLITAV